jgi:integrase
MSSDFLLAPAASAAGRGFKLYAGPEDGPAQEADGDERELSPRLRLSELYQRYALPVVGRACNWSAMTIASYGEGVAFWSELTRDLPLDAIDDFEAAEFVAGLRAQPGRKGEFLSTASVRKHCATVQRILQLAGPRVRTNQKRDLRRFGLGLLAEVPWIEAPEPDVLLPDGDFTHAEVLAILAACDAMTLPKLRGVPPGVWWRALVKFLCATGLRIGTTMALEWSMIGQQRLLIPGAIAKRKKPHEQYLHPKIAELLEPLKGHGPRVFAWRNWPRPGAVRWLQRNREKLLKAAGLEAHRRFGFHGFRKYHATELFESAGLETAAASLNHGSSATTAAAYVNHRAQADARLRQQREAIDLMRLLQE